ncbi:hypothetical protein [Streptomyces phaeolivaceus]|uniref:hypothetical protein n=1 Tax=Streptomyces phaeolivaceus TaxID=2653200 RepID=UPI00186A06FB|nr:hypothetical protein [Streptomyces phaeolivaceus]
MAPSGAGNVNKEGYRRVSAPDHPNANRHGRILEHRKVLSEKLGRPLRPEESAHHKNGDRPDNRPDNRPENLELWVKSQPAGQRASDLVAWAREIVERYGDEVERGIVQERSRGLPCSSLTSSASATLRQPLPLAM